MKVFVTGASGYIGGSVAARMIADGHEVTGLVRSDVRAGEVRDKGIEPVLGTLDDREVLAGAARAADAVVNAANADYQPAVAALLDALAGSGKTFIHTSGSSIVGTRAGGEAVDAIFTEETPVTPSPARAARVALNNEILAAADRRIRTIIICPSLIYGLGRGAGQHSMQVPWLITVAKKYGVAKHISSGGNLWSNVHIDDLVELYALALEKAPAGAFCYAENGENSMAEMCQSISRMLGFGGRTETMTLEEAAVEWGEGPANDTMGSNSRVRAERARKDLGWTPKAPALLDEIERGCYAVESEPAAEIG